jgi:replicative DNA helicase
VIFIREMSLQLKLLPDGGLFSQSNIEIEETVLATFINYPDSYYDYADKINLPAFSTEITRYVFTAIDKCAKESKIDIVTVSDTLRREGYVARLMEKSQRDLITYVNDICSRVFNDSHLSEHVKLLMQYSARRELTLLATVITDKANDMSNPDEIINLINQTIIDVQTISEEDEFDSIKILKEIVDNMQDMEGKNFIKSYIAELDRFIYGWELTDLIIIAGAPSMGKTAFALEIARNHIIRNSPIGIFSLEMSRQQLMTRLIASEACINLGRIRRKELDDADWQDIHSNLRKFEGKNYWIDDKSGNLWKICSKIRKLYMKHGCKFFIIDYLQLISVNVGKGNREQEISTISRKLKELARELGVVIIALSQISRKVTERSNKRPQLSDLRESGAIEQDADQVMFVYRPAYYDLEGGIPRIEEVEIIMAKGRSTGVGTINMKFISQFTKYVSAEDLFTNAKLQTFKGG